MMAWVLAVVGWGLFLLTLALLVSANEQRRESERDLSSELRIAEGRARDARVHSCALGEQLAEDRQTIANLLTMVDKASRAMALVAPNIGDLPRHVRAPLINAAKALGVPLPRVSSPVLEVVK